MQGRVVEHGYETVSFCVDALEVFAGSEFPFKAGIRQLHGTVPTVSKYVSKKITK